MKSDNFGLRDACGRPEARHRRSGSSMQNDPNPAELAEVLALCQPSAPLDHDTRRRRLDERVHENVIRQRARVESRSDYQALLVQGRRPNHVLHLLLTIFTLGLWLFVWAAVTGWTGEKRALLTVDEHGTVTVERL